MDMRLIQHDGVGFAFTTRFARYVDDSLSIVVLVNLGEDDEAAMPKRIADNVATYRRFEVTLHFSDSALTRSCFTVGKSVLLVTGAK